MRARSFWVAAFGAKAHRHERSDDAAFAGGSAKPPILVSHDSRSSRLPVESRPLGSAAAVSGLDAAGALQAQEAR
jgi:hypothetical protein